SPFRPDVQAGQHVAVWTSPFGVQTFFSQESTIPLEVHQKRAIAMVKSVEPHTVEMYRAGLLHFSKFCDEHSIMEEEWVPASDFLLSSFTSEFVSKIGVSAVWSWFAGLALWHTVQGVNWQGDCMVKQLVQAAAKHMPKTSMHELQPPVCKEHLIALKALLDLNKPMHTAIWVAVTFAFHGCCRLGEVIPPTRLTLDATRHVLRSVTYSRSMHVLPTILK
ncbi:hypothetical protein BKA62DRAFT_629981, partial [Auriculariales sp. MPI-PUGE-AT-0066]